MRAELEGALDRALLSAFVELVAPGGLVADLGCGPGRVASFLAQRGLDVVGVDLSPAMVAAARDAHPTIRFEEGRLDGLPLERASLAGATLWYSVIHTPPEHLGAAFAELARVVAPDGVVLLGFQTGADPVHRTDAYETGLPLSSYRHPVAEVADRLDDAGFRLLSTSVRQPELELDVTPQGFVLARRR